MSTNILNQPERRKEERYTVENLAIAIAKNPDAPMGRIVNVSLGGMALRYYAEKEWIENNELIDIIFENIFFMTNVPIQNVEDFMVSRKSSVSKQSQRLCCLKFGSLSHEQKFLLEEFLSRQKPLRT